MNKKFHGFTVFDPFHEGFCAQNSFKLIIRLSFSAKCFKIGHLKICQNWSSTIAYVRKI